MIVEYTWNFDLLGIYPVQYDRTDMVYTVVWKLFASTVENDITYQTGTTGKINIQYNPNAEWYDFIDLIPSEVQHWVEDQMEIDSPGSLIALKASLEQDLQNKVSNTMVMVDAPWLTTTTTTTTIITTTETTTDTTTTEAPVI
jgi:hypothetical protein